MAKYRTEQIRNVAVLGHGGSGKTTLTEALLFKTGATSRLGRVEDGTTVSDWDPEEHRRTISINLSVIPVEAEGNKINLIDTPGYLDFVGEVISALHVTEAGLLVVDAVAGAEVGTELAWNALTEKGVPRLVFVNKMDRENADFDKAVESLRSTLSGAKIVPMQLPIGSADKFNGVISVVTRKAYLGKEGKEPPIPADMVDAVEAAHQFLVEAAAESDDDLIMKYLDGEELTIEEVRHGMAQGIRNGTFTPVYCGSAVTGLGMDRLLQALARYVPAPNDHQVTAKEGDVERQLRSDPNGPVAAAVFKTVIDRFVGRMTYVRIYSGALHRDAQLVNQRTGKNYRIANLTTPRGKELANVDEVVAGDIAVVTKLDDVVTGDTLTAADHPVAVVPPAYPRPLYNVAVT
nr:GTP-binding protein [Caldilineaceae bacterium]